MEYLYTTRAGFSDSPGRSVGQAWGESGAFDAADVDLDGFTTVQEGADDAQIYAQIPFKFLDSYLAFSMIYDAESSEGFVHCRLSYSPDGFKEWQFVESLHGRDFIPLGAPLPCANFTPVIDSDGNPLNDCDVYREGETPAHTICSGTRTTADDMPLADCQAACSADTNCKTVQWYVSQPPTLPRLHV